MTSPDPQPDRRLRRSATDRKVAGVAGGLASHFDLDPSLVRIGFGVLSLVGGIGLALYAVCAIVLPAEEGAPDLSRKSKIGVGIIIVAALCSFPFLGHDGFFVGPGLVVLLALGALGVVVWRAVGGKPDAGLLKGALVIVTFAAALVLGVAAAFATALGAGVVAASVVIVAGLGLIVGGILGGARWLIIPAVAMAIPVTIVSAADIEFKGGVGDRVYRPASVEDLRPMYRLGAGRLRVDLRDVVLSPATTTDLKVRVGTGRLRLVAPKDACVQTVAHAGAGDIRLGGHRNDGIDVDADRRPTPEGNAPILRVDARVGIGEIIVSSDPEACIAR
ncbi:MAG: hypothetical protein QOF76_4169 [Solirubrobacteraceae bacterium]|jgi:phage shock protein PspC (stress-responsive transcriptional regulator)|nr:hypothetical protein [Solirubrobacteraceae bacterium]